MIVCKTMLKQLIKNTSQDDCNVFLFLKEINEILQFSKERWEHWRNERALNITTPNFKSFRTMLDPSDIFRSKEKPAKLIGCNTFALEILKAYQNKATREFK